MTTFSDAIKRIVFQEGAFINLKPLLKPMKESLIVKNLYFDGKKRNKKEGGEK